MKIQPLRDNVFLEADKPKNQTESGLLISEDWKSLPHAGTVISVGPDVVGIKAGDRVSFHRYGSIIIEKDLRICQQTHIYGVING
jgi:co-chaperonin GroES (HSP10)